MREKTTDYERGELSTCASCRRPVAGAGILERDPEEGALLFCDVRCREAYYEKTDVALDPEVDGREAA